MGCWGPNSFENDDAQDWLYEFTLSKSEDTVLNALKRVIQKDGYLEAPECFVALVAAEIVAASNGKPSKHIPNDLVACLGVVALKNPEIGGLARKAVARVRENSELKDLWDESGEPSEWRDEISDLESRLSDP